ncbi:unnamed protein product [Peronospora farinosa]|uniref:Uncharacterized protein n=1 Tax=Peronospora farinosa TaxID=134698 RepID=A0AAV0UNZ0_9STRA|nr:unnamed protein product [Peronospora farinosa]CAI5738192.1 unnamed protein product [Peronospora farinosa]
MKIAGFLCVALAGITTVVDHVTAKEAGYINAPLKSCPKFRKINHDDIRPFHQPTAATLDEKAAVKFKPRLTIGPHLCHAYPVVSQEGYISGGLNPTGPSDGQCKGNRYASQVYGRAAWYKGKYAIMYAWYFPKEQIKDKGHRYGWQTCILWLNNPANKDPEILAVSLSLNYAFMIHGPPARSKVDGTAVNVTGHLVTRKH